MTVAVQEGVFALCGLLKLHSELCPIVANFSPLSHNEIKCMNREMYCDFNYLREKIGGAGQDRTGE
jgi:hypothetical protein